MTKGVRARYLVHIPRGGEPQQEDEGDPAEHESLPRTKKPAGQVGRGRSSEHHLRTFVYSMFSYNSTARQAVRALQRCIPSVERPDPQEYSFSAWIMVAAKASPIPILRYLTRRDSSSAVPANSPSVNQSIIAQPVRPQRIAAHPKEFSIC